LHERHGGDKILNRIFTWFAGLGAHYGVNPWVFGAIYVGAIPFFSVSLAWLVRELRAKRPILLPALSSGFFFISAYLYLIIEGKHVPLWVYGFIAVMLGGGAYATVKKVRTQIKSL
jgi:ABC-type Co2+ transport system permease subunit